MDTAGRELIPRCLGALDPSLFFTASRVGIQLAISPSSPILKVLGTKKSRAS